VITAPSSKLTGDSRPYWATAEVCGCPCGVLICAICPHSAPDEVFSSLHREEQLYAERFQGDRRREWISGRHCLRAALSSFSPATDPILSLPTGAPVPPPGVAVSISHKAALTVALATDAHQGVGIDVECAEGADERLAMKVMTDGERLRGRGIVGSNAVFFVSTHFAVKEAIYKAVSAADQSRLDFEEIELDVPVERLTNRADWISVPARVKGLGQGIRAAILQDGRWVVAVASRG
jgi:4'-phosphopantetheinyl transferase EntD